MLESLVNSARILRVVSTSLPREDWSCAETGLPANAYVPAMQPTAIRSADAKLGVRDCVIRFPLKKRPGHAPGRCMNVGFKECVEKGVADSIHRDTSKIRRRMLIKPRLQSILNITDDTFHLRLQSSAHQLRMVAIQSSVYQNRVLVISIISTVSFPANELLFRR